MNEYPDYVRDEMERTSYDKYIAAVHENERWQALSWQEKTWKVLQREWKLNKKSLLYLFLAFCVGYTVMHVFRIIPSQDFLEDPYQFTR